MTHGEEAFQYARMGKVAELEDALKRCGPDEYIDYEGNTALCMALRFGKLEAAAMLIGKGADIKIRVSDESSILHLAVNSESIPCVKLVLSKFTAEDVNLVNDEGLTALHFAAYSNNLDIIKLLIEAGADVNVSAPERPLDDAKGECKEYLISKGALPGDTAAKPEDKVTLKQRFGYDCFDGETDDW